MSQENKNRNTKTWLITGASSGLGYALAKYVLEKGDRVVMGARTLDSMAALAERHPGRALAVRLDVTNAEQRVAAVRETEGCFEGIDVLVNNAGIDFLGAIEEQDERDYRAQFEVNFFGAVALLRLVLPGMRGRKQGTIINMSSMDGIASLPVNGYYSASKFASRRFDGVAMARDRAARSACLPRRTRLLPHRSRAADQVLGENHRRLQRNLGRFPRRGGEGHARHVPR